MSDTLASLETAARHLMVPKYITTSVGSLAIYDHLLTLDDEVSYVWQREKSWISYLFIVNRYLLLFYAIFTESVNGEHRHAQCKRNVFLASTLGMTLLLFSDVFITIRVYAVAGRNKLIVLYLSILICAKAVTGYYFISGLNTDLTLPDIPIDAFRECAAAGSFRLQISPHAIGVAFDISAFAVIIWAAYSNVAIVQFSFVLRTVVRDATVYFIMAMGIQAVVLLFLSFADVTISQFPLILHTVLTPALINRVFLSLKRAADADGTANRSWSTRRFSSMRFEAAPMQVTSGAVVSRPSDDPVETLSDASDYIPLNELAQHTKSRPLYGRLSVAS